MQKAPTVLHIITSEAWGGLELYVSQLILKLKNEGVEMGVYCLPNSIVGKKLISEGVTIIPAHTRSKFSPTDIKNVTSLIKKEGYSIIHAHTNKDMWLGSWVKLLNPKVKLIYNLYMSVASKNDLIHRFIYSRVDALVSTSEVINKNVEAGYPVKKEIIKLIRYGRDFEEYVQDEAKRKEIRIKWGAIESTKVVATICRIDKTKGVRELIDSFLLLPDEVRSTMQLWIVGDRTIHGKAADGSIVYEAQAEEAYHYLLNVVEKNKISDSVKLIPYQSDLIGYLSAIDIFVLASYNEMYSLAVIDAMLMEKLVIGTNAGGTPEQLGWGSRGVLVEPHNALMLAKGIAHAVTKFEELKELASKSKAWARAEHSWHSTLAKYLNLYRTI